MKAAQLSPDQVDTAVSIVQAILGAGLNPQEVAAAYRAAIAPPTMPTLPIPTDPAPFFAYLTVDVDSDPGISPVMVPALAIMAAIDATDYQGTITGLADLYRAERKARPQMSTLYAQQKLDAEQKPEPEPLPIEPAPLPIEPIEEVKP